MKVNAPACRAPVLIVGAGLSGLTTARLLTNAGIPNIVFEASLRDRSQGFSISLRDWGYSALLQSLGDLPLSSLTKFTAPDRYYGADGWIDQILRDNTTGRVLVAPDPEDKASIVRANRNALREWITDGGEDDVDVRYDHNFVKCTGGTGNIVAWFENGSSYPGSLLIAADGVHSAVRSQVLPHITPEVVPVVVYHGEFKLSHDEFNRLIRPAIGKSAILAGVGDGFNTPITVCNVTKTHVHLDWSYSRPATGDTDPLYRPNVSPEEAKTIPQALLDEIFSLSLAEPWSAVLNPDTIKNHSVFLWTSRCVFVSREDIARSTSQGVAFVGDSWHAMPIFGGEGGNHAIVDAVELAETIIDGRKGVHGDFKSLVDAYYDRSFGRCQNAVRRSRQRFYLLHRPMQEWKEISSKRSNQSSP